MSPVVARILGGLAVNIVLALVAYRTGSVRPSGALAGILLGTVITAGLGWSGLAVLGGFFVLGSVLTRMGYSKKEAMGAAEDQGGARGASHALANAGFPALFAVLALFTGNPVWTVAFVGAFATASMDTAGSELGPLYGRRTISLKTGAIVPPGTPGGVSLEGTLGGLGAATVLALLAWALGLLEGPSQVMWVLLGATLGNLYEGMVGARGLLPHTWLNATNTLVGGMAAALGMMILG